VAHRNEHSVEIDRPPGAVFPYLVVSDKRQRWMQMLAESEQVDDGEPALGTRFADVFDAAGRRLDLDSEIVEWEPHRRLATRIRAKDFESTARQSLEDLGGRTRLTTTIETDYTSRRARLMARVVTHHAQKQLESDLSRLKELVEAET
jgi:uncharacterized protein YndB with AHSA1/START domain